MSTLYELLEIDSGAAPEAIKQKILDRFLAYDADYGDDNQVARTSTLKAWPAILLASYETLCDPEKRAAYDQKPTQYEIVKSAGIADSPGMVTLLPDPSIEMSNHISVRVKDKAVLLGRNAVACYYAAATEWTDPLWKGLAYGNYDEFNSLDSKIRLLGAKYLLRHLKEHIADPTKLTQEEKNSEFSTGTVSIAVELFVRHPHLKDLFDSLHDYYEPGSRKGIEDEIGGKKITRLLYDLFHSEAPSAFNKIRWLGDTIAVLRSLNLDSRQNVSLLIQATEKEQWERIRSVDLAKLLNGITDIEKSRDLANENIIWGNLDWAYPADMAKLNNCLHKMLNHGLKIILEDTTPDTKPSAQVERRQGAAAIALAVELRNKLWDFGNKRTTLDAFKDDFKKCLHSKDKSIDNSHLGKHRKAWKVIVANILLALTGIGLIAIVGNLAVNQRFFGQRTKREEIRDAAEKKLNTEFKPGG